MPVIRFKGMNQKLFRITVILLAIFVSALLITIFLQLFFTNDTRTSLKVTATTYNAVAGQCDDTPFITASGKKIDKSNPGKHRFVALSRDLLSFINYGDTIEVSGAGIYDGLWVVADCMNKRFKAKIDFLIDEKQKIGKWNSVTIKFKQVEYVE